jgi:hypothetical protein
MAISRIENNAVRSGNDAVYGRGTDGNGVISGTVTLTRDMHYENLNVPLGNILLTAGFKVFVQNTATINGVVGIGTVTGNIDGSSNGTITSPGSAVSAGTLSGHTSGAITYRIGGQGGGNNNPNVTALPTYLLKNISSMIGGAVIHAAYASSPIALAGGSLGTTGATGATTSVPSSWAGMSGVTGVAGATGLTGATGVAGVTGVAGATGVLGATGLAGATGVAG